MGESITVDVGAADVSVSKGGCTEAAGVSTKVHEPMAHHVGESSFADWL